jgi:hypothetical protein
MRTYSTYYIQVPIPCYMFSMVYLCIFVVSEIEIFFKTTLETVLVKPVCRISSENVSHYRRLCCAYSNSIPTVNLKKL